MQRQLLALAVALLATPAALAQPASPSQSRVNVLFLIADDLTAEALSCYGNAQCKTPNIDALAARGVRFTRAYCQFPVCGPARAALLSGLYPQANGVKGNGGSAQLAKNLGDRPTLPELFKNSSYHTARVSKLYHMRVPGDITAGVDGPDHLASWTERFNCRGPEWMSEGAHEHLSGERLKFERDKHYNLGFGTAFYAVKTDTDGSEQPDQQAATKAIELLRAHRDGPFFLAVGMVRPHVPLVAPADYFEPYPWETMELAEKVAGDQDDIPKQGITGSSRRRGLAGKLDNQKKVLEAYYASVAYMDAQVGRIVKELDEQGLRDDTVVVFTSDHGYHLGEHDLWQKLSLHEESMRVPLIIAGPGIAPAETAALVEHIDVYPTLVDLAGLPEPGHLQGRSLVPVLDAPDASVRSSAYGMTGRGHMLRTDRFAYLEYNKGGAELYDMNVDPRQYHNLAADAGHSDVVAQLKGQLAARRAAAAPAIDSVAPLRIFVFAGQSNMEGADTDAADIDRYPPFRGFAAPQEDVRYWYENGATGSGNASDGWIAMGPDKRNRFGPELTFAKTLKGSVDGPIAILKSSWGGTTLAHDWDPDEPSDKRLFARTLKLIENAKSDLDRRGMRYRFEAIVWHQGENDMLNRELMNGYGERLGAFIARWRMELDTPDLKFFVGEISGKGIWGLDHRRNMQVVREHQRRVCAADPLTYFVPTSHLAFAVMNSGQPHYHFGTEGQLQHGTAYAAAYLASCGTSPVEPRPAADILQKGTKARVFIVAGQRSAEGEGAYAAQALLARFGAGHPRLMLRYRVAGGLHSSPDWVPIGEPNQDGTFGPEFSLATELADRTAETDTIAIVKVTHSAAALADWLPDPDNASRPQYAGAIAFVKDAMTDLRRRGLDPELSAWFWIPGEHDAWWGPFRNRYDRDLAKLVAATRKDLDHPTLPWIVAELSDSMRWGTDRLDELDAAIARVAAADAHLSFVDTDDIEVPPGAVTFGAAGTLELGRVLARAYLAIRRENKR